MGGIGIGRIARVLKEPRQWIWHLFLGILMLSTMLLQRSLAIGSSGSPLLPWDFSQVAPRGFGDRQNSWAWSMQWWRGRLYVGTNRAMRCVEAASTARNFPGLPLYPPTDPDIECADAWEDLPLQAEIWGYTPETRTWELVFRSSQDIPIPDHPGKFVARDIGFRGMTVFAEADGTEALYVAGVSPRTLYEVPGQDPGLVPPPRILRTTDGTTFEPIPQDSGTFMGDLSHIDEVAINSLRSLIVYNGRLYVIAGRFQGQGVLLESANPSAGNNEWRWVSPPGVRVFEVEVFNGQLYLGLDYKGGEDKTVVLRMDASGDLPYTFTPVLTVDAISEGFAVYRTIVSMHVFQNRLYVGTDSPCDLIRFNPDDTWELIVGDPREIDGTMVYALSGFGSGFDWWLNGHFWRMADYDGTLYVGTMDRSTEWKDLPGQRDKLEPYMGFDLYASTDGVSFMRITDNGFGQKFDLGVRTLASTPYGLFLGTANEYYGLMIWQGVPGGRAPYTVYLPIVTSSSSGMANLSPPSRD